jgi:hypothetical protein
MFQWFYDLVMSYIMPIIASIMEFLGLDGKKVRFEKEVKGGAEEPFEEELPVEDAQ